MLELTHLKFPVKTAICHQVTVSGKTISPNIGDPTHIDNSVRQFDTVVTAMDQSHSLCKRHLFLLSPAFVTTNILASIKPNRSRVTVGNNSHANSADEVSDNN